MSIIPEAIIASEAEARDWKMPHQLKIEGYWNINRESKCKNLIIDYICKYNKLGLSLFVLKKLITESLVQSIGILLPNTISILDEYPDEFDWIVDESYPDWKRKWWITLLKNKAVRRKGKRIMTFSSQDYMYFKQAIKNGDISARRKHQELEDNQGCGEKSQMDSKV